MDHRFVEAIQEIDEDVTSGELADIVWLAAHMRGKPSEKRHPGKLPRGTPPRSAKPPSLPSSKPRQQSTIASQRTEEPSSGQQSAELRLPLPPSAQAQPGVSIRSPAVPAIPSELELIRALSALQRRTPSTSRTVPDEVGTASFIAETGLWSPQFVPVLERWLDVALVVDGSASMAMWQRTLTELRTLLERTGAFRDIRVWHLNGDQHDKVSISSRPGKAQQSRRDPSELVDPGGRRLIIIASDCVGSAWGSPAMRDALTLWASSAPTVIINMLPQRLWADCAPPFHAVRMRAHAPGVPNSRLVVEGRFGDIDVQLHGLPIPVLELERRWLRSWADLVAGTSGGWVNGCAVFARTLDGETEHQDDVALVTPDERIRHFRAQASPTAYQLATFLAAGAPLTLRVMRLVQGAMLPSSTSAHLAEVFLSGLLRRVGNGTLSSDHDDVEYEFRSGVRDQLLDRLPRPEALQVLATVSKFVSHRLGSPLDFMALLTTTEQPNLQTLSPPFAQVAIRVLNSLGGRYADAAEQLTRLSSRASRATSHGVRYKDQRKLEQPGENVTSVSPASALERGRQEMPKIMRDVPSRNPRFTGRSDLIRNLHNTLVSSTERAALLPHTLHGLGGVGKTHLAIEYVHRFAHEYDLICWLPAHDVTQVRDSLVELGHAMGLPDNPQNVTRAIEAVLDALRTGEPYRRWLLVFDNADQPEDLRPYLPYPTGHVLLTSRNAGWSEVANAFEIDVFDREESIALIRRRVDAISDQDADRLADRLGDLPLALDQAAAWQAQTGMQVDEYLRLFDKQFERLTEHPTGEYPTPVGATYALTLDRLREQSPGAAQLLDVCAFFGAEPISVSLLWAGRQADLPSPLARTLRDQILLRRALLEISKYALARVDSVNDELSVHRLVQVVLRSRLDETEREQTKLAAQRILAAANPAEPDVEGNWPRHRELSPHIMPADLVEADEDETRQVVVDQIRYRWSRGDYESSEELGRITVERWREPWGDSDVLNLLSRRHLAVTLQTLGYYDEARELAEHTLAQFQRLFGDDHEHTLVTADSVAWAQRISGKYREARRLDEDNLGRWRRVYGDDHPKTLKAANNFAIDLRWLGDFTQAREVDEESVRLRRTVYGEENRNTQLAITSLARDHYGLGNYSVGLEMQERALEIQSRVLGPTHAEVLSATRNLIVLLRKVGHHARARDLAVELVETYEQRFGKNDEPTLAANVSLVNAMRVTGQLDEALRLGQEVLRRYRKAFGPEHPATLACTTNLAIVLRHRESFGEALTLNEATLDAFRAVLGDDHPFTLCCATNKANDLASLHRHEEARELSEDTLRRSRAVRGDDHPYTYACTLNVALDRHTAGDESAESLMGQAVDGFKRRLGDNHPETLEAMAGRRADCDIEVPET